jgi:hypothetical protein
MTALCSLAYLPVGLLAWRFGGRAPRASPPSVLMVNPLFIQNATYPWTKLQAVFFILTGLYFFLRVRDGDGRLSGRAAPPARSSSAARSSPTTRPGPTSACSAAAWARPACGAGAGTAGFARATRSARARRRLRPRPLVRLVGGRVRLARHVPLEHERHHAEGCPATTWSRWRSTCATPSSPLRCGASRARSSGRRARGGRSGTSASSSTSSTCSWRSGASAASPSCGRRLRAARAAAPRDRLFWALALGGIRRPRASPSYGDREHYGIGPTSASSPSSSSASPSSPRGGPARPGWRGPLLAGLGRGLLPRDRPPVRRRGLRDRPLAHPRAQPHGGLRDLHGWCPRRTSLRKSSPISAYFSDILTTPPALVLALLGALLCMALVRARRAAGGPRNSQ